MRLTDKFFNDLLIWSRTIPDSKLKLVQQQFNSITENGCRMREPINEIEYKLIEFMQNNNFTKKD